MDNKYKAVIVAIIILFVGLYFYQTRTLTKSECYRLGSNERMYACLAEVESRNPTPTTEPSYLPDNQLGLIILHGGNMTGNSYYNPNPTYTVSVENKTSYTLYDVLVKFTFYPLGKNCNDLASDTQYVVVTESILSGDSQAVKTTISTPFDTSGRFTWCSQVVGAKISQ